MARSGQPRGEFEFSGLCVPLSVPLCAPLCVFCCVHLSASLSASLSVSISVLVFYIYLSVSLALSFSFPANSVAGVKCWSQGPFCSQSLAIRRIGHCVFAVPRCRGMRTLLVRACGIIWQDMT